MMYEDVANQLDVDKFSVSVPYRTWLFPRLNATLFTSSTCQGLHQLSIYLSFITALNIRYSANAVLKQSPFLSIMSGFVYIYIYIYVCVCVCVCVCLSRF